MAFPSHRRNGYNPDHGITLAMESLGEHLLSGLSEANRRYTERFRSLATTLQFDLRHLCVNLQLATDTSCRESEARLSTIISELRTKIEKANEAHSKERIAEKRDHDQRYQALLNVLEANHDEVKVIREAVKQLSKAYEHNTKELERTTEENRDLKRHILSLEKSIQENSDNAFPGNSEVDHSENWSERSDLRDHSESDQSDNASAGDSEFNCSGGNCNDDDNNTEVDQYQSEDGIESDQTNCNDSNSNDGSEDDQCKHNGSDHHDAAKDESLPSYASSSSPQIVQAASDQALQDRINNDNSAKEDSSAAPNIMLEVSSRAHGNEIYPVKHRTRMVTDSRAGLNRVSVYPDHASNAYVEPRVRMSSFVDDFINADEGRLQTTLGSPIDRRTIGVGQPIRATRPVYPTTDAGPTGCFGRIGSEYGSSRFYYPEESYVRVSPLPSYGRPSLATDPSPYVNVPSAPRNRGVTDCRFAGTNTSPLTAERSNNNTRMVQHPYPQGLRRLDASLGGYVYQPTRMKRRTAGKSELEATSLNPSKRVRMDGQFRRYN